MAGAPVPAARGDGALVRSWVAWTTGAEFVGFLAPASAAAVTRDAGPGVTLPLLLVAGAAEGLILGAAQARVLVAALPRLSRWRWTVATGAAAVVAWLIGLAPSATASLWQRWPVAVQAGAAGVGGLALLASIGIAQWWVLRGHVPRAWCWIVITAVAWLAGLAAFMLVASPLWHEGQATALVVAIGALAGLVMAATVAVVTGLGLRALLTTASRNEASGP